MARAFWRLFFPGLYAFLRATDPLFVRLNERRGLVNTVEVFIVGRRSGIERRVVVGLLAVGERRYVGHANGRAHWTRNLAAAQGGRIVVGDHAPIPFRIERLAPGAEQDDVVRAASRQHPFPIDFAYRIARPSIRLDGVFFRLEATDGGTIPLPARFRQTT